MIIEELRIGNLVNEANRMNSKTLLTGETVYIESKIMGLGKYGCRILQGVNYKDILIDGLKPIPLTEEWLNKFGFIKNEEHLYYTKNYSIEKEFILNEYFFVCDVAHEVCVKSVHHLQNVYFALTGEELEIKE